MKHISFIVLVLLTGVTITWGQTRPATAPAATATTAVPPVKIALVFPYLFNDEKEGITKLVAAYRQLNTEFAPKQQELKALENRIQAVADEFQKLNAANANADTLRPKQEEHERLMREMRYKKEDAEKAYQKRHDAVIGPISLDIGKALQDFANAEGITMTLDGDKLGESLLTMMPAMDVTRAFIKYYNQKNPR